MVHTSPLVSVAMATYNGEKYIKEQLESIISQTYKNIEVVITDDASTDDTIKVINEFKNKHGFIKVFLSDINKGVTQTFEHSFTKCGGDFIAISDQDDIWEPNKIETLLAGLDQEDAVYSNSLLIDKTGKSLHKEFKSLMKLQSYYDGSPFLMGNCIPGHTILMKTGFAKTILPLPRGMMFDRWISFCAASNNGIKYVDKPLVRYRQHENNSVGVGRSKKKEKKKTKQEMFAIKLSELKAFETAPIKNEETRQTLKTMLRLFTRKLSLRRSLFFFKNIDRLLIIKNKSYFRKLLYCFKMIVKANY